MIKWSLVIVLRYKEERKMKGLYRLPMIAVLLFDIFIGYIALPAINIHNFGLWTLIIINVFCIWSAMILKKGTDKKRILKSGGILIGICVCVMALGTLSGSKMLNARRYSKVLNIQIEEHLQLPGIEEINQIPLMDTESSKVLGNRKIGALSNIVSQFEVSEDYMTIAYHQKPEKVSPLKYADFWKWNANKKGGIPGYVIVDPIELTAEYVEVKEGMKYVPSAYLSQDLARYIYFKYPTTLFDYPHFEIDEDGNPMYVSPTYTYTIGLFGGKTITGAIVVDPVSGEIEKYDRDNIPSWVDIVYNGDYISKYFDIYGQLINGFWNSLFGQKGLIESTTTTTYGSDGESYRDNDFGYVVKGDDVYIYTGVTAVTNDESNIGYLLANERDGSVVMSYFESTDEDSVMRAAEGEVQEKGYRACFPSLIDVNGTPAYIMVLKDNLGLVKMYAIVDAAQYSHMVVSDTLEKTISQFTNGNINLDSMYEKTVTVKRIAFVNVDSETMVYIVDENDNIYYANFEKEMMLLEEGKTVQIITDGTIFRLQK